MLPEETPNPDGADGARDDALVRAFGLGDGDEGGDGSPEWIAHARRALRPPASLGRIGPYELLEELGHGGQGTVYKSRQPGTERVVAIKRLAAAAGSEGSSDRDRIPREVEALTRLEHPNVVTVHGVDMSTGHALLIMQLVDGDPIDQWADAAATGPRWAERVLAVFAQVCDGVAHAHQRGVIHRDIKPSNVLVDRTDTPRVLDFGIAQVMDGAAGARERTDPTTIGFAGTPIYAAPERLAGRAADTRGDVYSLGVLLYRLLAGADPFAHAGGMNQLVEAVGSGRTARPSAVRAGLSPDLDWIVLKAMAVDPERRYQSVGELSDDVRRFLVGEPIAAHPPTLAYRLRTFVRRSWLPLAAACVVAGALIAVTVVSWRSAVRVAAALAETKLALERESEARRLADVERDKSAQYGEILREIARAGDTGSMSGRLDMTVREALDQASRRLLESEGSQSSAAEVTLRLAIAEIYVNMGLVDPAERHLQMALARQVASFGPSARETLEPRHQLARIYRTTGRLDQAAAMQRGVVDARRDAGESQRLYLAQALASLAITLRHLKAFDEAEAALREALAIYSEKLGPADENVGQVLASLATLMGTVGRLDEAEELGRRAVAIARANHPDLPHHDRAAALCNLAVVLCARGNVTEGEAMMREGLAMHRAASGERHIMSAQAATWLADHLGKQGRWDEAVPLLESALDAYRFLHPAGSTAIATAAEALRKALVAAGRAEDARKVEPAAHPAADGKDGDRERAGSPR